MLEVSGICLSLGAACVLFMKNNLGNLTQRRPAAGYYRQPGQCPHREP